MFKSNFIKHLAWSVIFRVVECLEHNSSFATIHCHCL